MAHVDAGPAEELADTDYHGLGTGNIEEIPINRPVVETNFNQRDGYVRHRIDVDPVHFHKNSLAGNTPAEAPPGDGGYTHYPEGVSGVITRDAPSASFTDHFSRARLFWNSLSPIEKDDLIRTFAFHLGKVKSKSVRQQNVDMFANVDVGMAAKIADMIGSAPPSVTAHVPVTAGSPALSLANQPRSAYTQKVGIIMGNGFNDDEVGSVIAALEQHGAFCEVISEKLGTVTGMGGTAVEVNETFITTYPVLFDSLYIVGGAVGGQDLFDMKVVEFVDAAFKFCKPIGVATTGQKYAPAPGNVPGVVTASNNPNFIGEFLAAVARQRFWERRPVFLAVSPAGT